MTPKKITRWIEVETETDAQEKIRREIENFTWLSRERKDQIIASATLLKHETKFGPIFEATFSAS